MRYSTMCNKCKWMSLLLVGFDYHKWEWVWWMWPLIGSQTQLGFSVLLLRGACPYDDIWGICVYRGLFFCLEIKSLSIHAMKRAQGNSFLKSFQVRSIFGFDCIIAVPCGGKWRHIRFWSPSVLAKNINWECKHLLLAIIYTHCHVSTQIQTNVHTCVCMCSWPQESSFAHETPDLVGTDKRVLPRTVWDEPNFIRILWWKLFLRSIQILFPEDCLINSLAKLLFE